MRRPAAGAGGWPGRWTTSPTCSPPPRQIAAQTRQRLAGQIPDGATRRVSLHEPHARPITQGRLGGRSSSGTRPQLVEGDGVIVDHTVERGNPAGAAQLAPAVERVSKRAGRPPGTVTADRGCGEKIVDDALHRLGVADVVIQRKAWRGQGAIPGLGCAIPSQPTQAFSEPAFGRS